MAPFPGFIGSRTTRTNFLSVGVTLCAIIAAICAAPLAFVTPWIAIWLLCLMSVLVLGTFCIWAFHAIKNPRLLDTEHHVEQMAAISVMGQNRENGTPLLTSFDHSVLTQNPSISNPEEGGEHGSI